MKTVWIVNKYAMPPQYESRLRAIKFAHYLTLAGYKVIVFGASSMHNMEINLIKDRSPYIRKKYDDIDFVHIKSRQYRNTAGLNRILSEFEFYYRLRSCADKFEKPDCILQTAGPLISNPILKYALRHKIPFIQESLDVWPDDFVDLGLISSKNPIMKILYSQAKYNCAQSDALIYSWSGCYEYLKQKKWDMENGGPVNLDKVFYINNGVDLNDFNQWKSTYILQDADLNSHRKKIIYLGSLRLANNVMQLVKAAEVLLPHKEDAIFLIYGDGDDRGKIIEYCREHNLTNVVIKDKWVDPKYVPYILSQSYINILNYTENFGKHGISSSKMFQYMASGKPIVCNINIYDNPIEKYKIGISRHFESPLEYAKAIEAILNMSVSEYNDMCKSAVNASKEFDYKHLTDQLIDVMNIIS